MKEHSSNIHFHIYFEALGKQAKTQLFKHLIAYKNAV